MGTDFKNVSISWKRWFSFKKNRLMVGWGIFFVAVFFILWFFFIDAPAEFPEGVVIEIPKGVKRLFKENIDVALLALHGPGGEDGTIQGML